MKDFTTPEYLTPIIEEINANYTIDTSETVRACLDCIAMFKSKTTRDAFIVREAQPFNYLSGQAIKALYAIVKQYANYAETEDGELYFWRLDECERIQHAIRDTLAKQAQEATA